MRSHVRVVSPRAHKRNAYGSALRGAGFDVSDPEGSAASESDVSSIEVDHDLGSIVIRASGVAPVRLSDKTSAEDLARVVGLVAEAQELSRRVHILERAGAMSLVAGVLAHDANNAITYILAAAHELGSHRTQVERGDVLSELADGCMRLAGILRRLHSLQQNSLGPQTFQVKTRITELDHMLRALAGKTRRLTIRVADALPAVRMDPSDLDRALINLVANARDATSSGDEIIVAARRVVLDAEVRSVPKGTWVVLSVEDHGVGMDKETLARATEPFFTTKSVGNGTGLGLVSVARAVKEAHGHLTIESTLGEGTLVELWLPAT